MNGLLQDPVFYNLLVNNKESLLDKSSSATPLTAKESRRDQQESDTERGLDEDMFTYPGQMIQNAFHQHPHMDVYQQHHTEPPLRSEYFMEVKHQHSSIKGDTSYQPSIFSDQLSMSTDTLDGVNYHTQPHPPPHIDEFFMKEIPNQIRMERNETIMPNVDTTQESRKFHRYYTSPGSSSVSLPCTTPNNEFKIKKPSSNYHQCPFCDRSFKNKSYLSRHLKKHDTVKDFKCPFFNPNHTKCHHMNGEFSRKDTFKAHLKSIHFVYPIGVGKSERNESSGRCAGCFEEFENNNVWLTDHIETDKCPAFVKK